MPTGRKMNGDRSLYCIRHRRMNAPDGGRATLDDITRRRAAATDGPFGIPPRGGVHHRITPGIKRSWQVRNNGGVRTAAVLSRRGVAPLTPLNCANKPRRDSESRIASQMRCGCNSRWVRRRSGTCCENLIEKSAAPLSICGQTVIDGYVAFRVSNIHRSIRFCKRRSPALTLSNISLKLYPKNYLRRGVRI